MYDDNLHDVTSHMRMLHGDVISQTHGPGVNLFKPAVDGRRFWVSAKSPVFGWTIAACCDYCGYCNYFDYLTLSFSVTCSSLQWIRLCAHTSSVSSAPPSFIQKQSKNLRSSWTLNSICKSHDCHCEPLFQMTLAVRFSRTSTSEKSQITKPFFFMNPTIVHMIDHIFWLMGFKTKESSEEVWLFSLFWLSWLF